MDKLHNKYVRFIITTGEKEKKKNRHSSVPITNVFIMKYQKITAYIKVLFKMKGHKSKRSKLASRLVML